MKHVTSRSLRRPLVLVGITIVLSSTIGLVLAVGTIVSLGYVPTSLIQQARQMHGSKLAADGLSEEVVQLVRTGELIPEELRVELSEDDLEVLRFTEQVLSALMQAATDAAKQSKSKSQIGIAVCLAALILGAIITARGFRQGASSAASPA